MDSGHGKDLPIHETSEIKVDLLALKCLSWGNLLVMRVGTCSVEWSQGFGIAQGRLCPPLRCSQSWSHPETTHQRS